jgi:hypothetical protein
MWRLKGRNRAADKSNRAKNGRGKKPRPYRFEALEPRLLLSADVGLPVDDLQAVPGIEAPVIEEAAPAEVETVQAGDNLDPTAATEIAGEGTSGTMVPGPTATTDAPSRTIPPHPPPPPRLLHPQSCLPRTAAASLSSSIPPFPMPVPHRCLLEDSGKDWSVVTVVDGLQKENAAATAAAEQGNAGASNPDTTDRSGVFIYYLDADKDGVRQVTDILQQYTNLDAVYLLSHGASGEISLGTTAVLQNVLQDRAAEIAAWGDSLKDGADILLYGCDVASGEAGVEFVRTLSSLTARTWPPRRTRRARPKRAATGTWNTGPARSRQRPSLPPATAGTAT